MIDPVSAIHDTALEYLPADAVIIDVYPIGNGNLNKVYKLDYLIRGSDYRSCCVKFAPLKANISDRLKLDLIRGEREGLYYKIRNTFAPGSCPVVYGYDKNNRMLYMEYINGRLLRDVISAPALDIEAEKIASFLIDSLMYTRETVYDSGIEFGKVDFDRHLLCDLTDLLVFDEPYRECPYNSFSNDNERFIDDNLLKNDVLLARVGYLRNKFNNQKDCLIHGDLHSGSVFVTDRGPVVFDAEFAFFGPLAYDAGNLAAHYIIAAIDLLRKGSSETAENAIRQISDILQSFFIQTKNIVTDILIDTVGFAATEIIRRVIGMAKVPELTRISDPYDLAVLERVLLDLAVALLTDDNYRSESFVKNAVDSFCGGSYGKN